MTQRQTHAQTQKCTQTHITTGGQPGCLTPPAANAGGGIMIAKVIIVVIQVKTTRPEKLRKPTLKRNYERKEVT